MPDRDWVAWHEPYEDAATPLARRLALVQRRIRETLDRAPAGALRAISACAGQGRDLIGALREHARAPDVRARLVERDPRNADAARASAAAAGLAAVEVWCGDAGTTDAYDGAVPAELVLFCGVFGNVSDADVARTVSQLPRLCARGGTVIWTRHRRPPDLTPSIRAWLDEAGFEEVAFDAPADSVFTVGTHRLRGEPPAFARGVRLFEFVGYDALAR
jgi:hypothetical protein